MIDEIQTIKQVLMTRDGLTADEATVRIQTVKDLMHEYLDAGNMQDAETICADEFGLEPDYLFELLW